MGGRSKQYPNFNARVLVAEDVEINQRIAREMLQILGCKVFIAPDGAEAVKIFKEDSIDIVLMDCQMPKMDGFDATKAIRKYESDEALAKTPIVALTAGTTKADQEKCRSAGMDSFISKPFGIDDVVTVLGERCSQTRVDCY